MTEAPANRGDLLIYGAGGHGLVVADAALAGGWRVVGFVDDRPAPGLMDRPAWAPADMPAGPAVIVAIGDNAARQRIAERLRQQGRTPATVVHPSAAVSGFATLGPGVFIGPLAVVNARADVGAGAIVNSGAIVEHHVGVGAFAHVAPGAQVGGKASVGALTLVGLGASVLPGVHVGDRCTVGAGAVILRDVPDGQTIVGVPGRGIAN